jgi:hypothetical protein
MRGRLSWRPLSFQIERAMSPIGDPKQSCRFVMKHFAGHRAKIPFATLMGLKKAGASVVLEQFLVAHIAGQSIRGPVSARGHHLEQRRTALYSAGQEAGA